MQPRVGLTSIVVVASLLAGCGPPSGRPAQVVAPVPGRPGAASGALRASASPWPGAIHDARHASAVAAGVVGPQDGRVRWERRLEGNVTPGPAVAVDGTVYAASNAGTLHALDPSTGADRWTFDGGTSYGSDLSTTPAVLADGTILWPGPANTLFALDPAGRLLWRQRFDGFVLSPVDRGDGRVYVMTMTGTLTALDAGPARHAVAWAARLGGPSYGSPAIAPDGTVVTTVDDEVVAVTDTGSDGVVRWRWRAPAMIEVSAAVAPDGTVVVGPNDEYAYGLNADGSVRWRWRSWRCDSGTPTLMTSQRPSHSRAPRMKP